ncbi:MFS transporter [Mycolicibacterium iranicum]|uniref:Major facilitator superfamily (MFS) profile domain-containing protein n=1 Tax=Mycolicibacterium iranicum TaxID=912594 RepID=A0A178LRW6_MYCIR|nr:MFS transporter [Mycolicibacterium iranicum]OAN35126.1 hypothetical protein A4X20_26400 [Mycolicibacterium iranicum]
MSQGRHPLQYRQFVIYWLAGIVSNVGTWLQTVTAGVVIYQMTGSAFLVGVLGFANFAPVFALAITGGFLTDRYGPRIIVIVTHAAAFVAGVALTVLSFTGHAGPATLIVTAALFGTCYALAKPALSSMIPALVPKSILPKATAINTMQFIIGQVTGSLLSTMLLTTAGASWAFGVNCLSFIAPAIAMIAIGQVGGSSTERRKALDDSDGGALAVAHRTPPMVTILVTIALANAAVEGLRTVTPAFVTEALHVDPEKSGLMVAAFSIGNLLGLFAFGTVHQRVGGWLMLISASTMSIAGAAVIATATSLPVTWGGAGLMGLGFSSTIPVLNSTLLLLSPDLYRGRVMSLFAMAHLGFRPVWSLAAGAVASVLGPRWALGVLAVVSFGALGGVLRLREATEHPPIAD